MHCSLSLLSGRDCISKRSGLIVVPSLPSSADGQPTPFHANYMLSGGLFFQPTGHAQLRVELLEHAHTRLIKLGNIPPPMFILMGAKREFWLAGCSIP